MMADELAELAELEAAAQLQEQRHDDVEAQFLIAVSYRRATPREPL